MGARQLFADTHFARSGSLMFYNSDFEFGLCYRALLRGPGHEGD